MADDSGTAAAGNGLTSWATPQRLRVARLLLAAAYAITLGVYCVVQGVPMDRLLQAVWILVGIGIAMIGRPPRDLARVLLDWLPFIGLLLAYDYTRGVADSLGAPVHVVEPAHADEALFSPLLGGRLPTIWLQNRLYDITAIRWWDVVVALVYFTHFVLPWALAAVLYVRDRNLWKHYAVRIVALSFAGLVTYVVYPAAPPWFASRDAVVPVGIDRIATRGWEAIGLKDAGTLLAQGQAGGNLVAAIPSLHAATALLVSVVLWRFTRNRVLRAVLVAYPLAMAFSLVYGGEHYVVDVLLGWAYVVAILALARAWERHRARRRALSAAEPVGSDGEGLLVDHVR